METESQFFKDVHESFNKIVDAHGEGTSLLIIATRKIDGENDAESAVMVNGDNVLISAGLMESMDVPELKGPYRAAQAGSLIKHIDTIRKTQQN